MKTSSADGGRKRWLAWYAADCVPSGRPGDQRRAVGIRSHPVRHCVISALLVAAVAVTGCGPAGGDRRLEPLDRSRLTAQLAEVRDAARSGDRSAAGQALDGFAGEVRRLQRAGTLDGPTARALLLGAERARDRLEVELAPPPQTQPVEPAPEPPRREQTTPKPSQQPKSPAKEQTKKPEEQQESGSGHDKGHKGGKEH